jgi:hypothetical protein
MVTADARNRWRPDTTPSVIRSASASSTRPRAVTTYTRATALSDVARSLGLGELALFGVQEP